MIETYKEFAFVAAHSLPPHASLYGHSFKVRLHLSGNPDPVFGWAANLKDVDRHVHEVVKRLNNRHLNEIQGLALPSMENIARWIWLRTSHTVSSRNRRRRSSGTHGTPPSEESLTRSCSVGPGFRSARPG
jgi:6-pyruvoyltetrahydropterin/6-carboxytetrahydropterin synthase